MALVTDAGTPAISDPGAEVVEQAGAAGFRVVTIPGPSAPTALLSVSGLPAPRHLFVGYPPHRAGERRRWIEELAGRRECLVLLEAPTRIAATLADLSEILGGDRRVVVGRELTKMHEEILRGTLGDMVEELQGGGRGEFTLVVEGAGRPTATLPEGTIDRLKEALPNCTIY